MKLSPGDWIVVAVTVLYVCACIAYLMQRKYASAVVFGGYAVANVGVIWGLR